MRLFAGATAVGLHSQSKGANRTPPDRPFACLPEAQGAHPFAATGAFASTGGSPRGRTDRQGEDIVSTIDSAEPTRRDFLYIATGVVGAVGAAAAAWPLIAQMNPDASTIAAGAPIEVDLAPIAEGQVIKVFWRGKPIFINHRTKKEIEEAEKVNLASLPDPEPDSKRVKAGHADWQVLIAICTHLGCIPLAHQGEFDGYFCPCHGSQYDTSGRIRRGPAPTNLALPPYEFVSDSKIRIG
jgi:ubiquinol-cytochrome c reductase iron-sulfur subunit